MVKVVSLFDTSGRCQIINRWYYHSNSLFMCAGLDFNKKLGKYFQGVSDYE